MRTIGVDFGHCESAATCLNSSHNAVERLAVSAETKAPVIPSAIYLTKQIAYKSLEPYLQLPYFHSLSCI